MKVFGRELSLGEVVSSLQEDNIDRNTKLKVVCEGMDDPLLAYQILCNNYITGRA